MPYEYNINQAYLPLSIIPYGSNIIPHWQPYSKKETKFFKTISITYEDALDIEKETITQSHSMKRLALRKSRKLQVKPTKYLFEKRILRHYIPLNLLIMKKNCPNLFKMQ